MMTHTHNKQPSLMLLIVIAMTSPLALNLFIPAMPSAVVALHTDMATMQLTYSSFLLTLAFGQLISGPLADYFGRYPVLITGLIIHFFGCIFAILADDINLLIAARVLQALGGSACMSMARTMTLDVYGREKSASKMSYLVMAIALSQTLAPTLGGYINLYFNWQATFIISSSIAFAVFLLATKQLTETCPQKSSSIKVHHVLHQYSQVLKSDQYISYALSSTFIACAFYLFIGSAPYIVVNYLGGNSADFGNWFLMVALAFMLGSLCSGSLAKHMTINSMIFIGHTISLLGATLLLLLNYNGELNYFSLFIHVIFNIWPWFKSTKCSICRNFLRLIESRNSFWLIRFYTVNHWCLYCSISSPIDGLQHKDTLFYYFFSTCFCFDMPFLYD